MCEPARNNAQQQQCRTTAFRPSCNPGSSSRRCYKTRPKENYLLPLLQALSRRLQHKIQSCILEAKSFRTSKLSYLRRFWNHLLWPSFILASMADGWHNLEVRGMVGGQWDALRCLGLGFSNSWQTRLLGLQYIAFQIKFMLAHHEGAETRLLLQQNDDSRVPLVRFTLHVRDLDAHSKKLTIFIS